MGKLITLKDDVIVNVFTVEDALQVVSQYAGDELAEYIKSELDNSREELHSVLQMSDINEVRCDEYENLIFNVQNELDLALSKLADMRDKFEELKNACEECE